MIQMGPILPDYDAESLWRVLHRLHYGQSLPDRGDLSVILETAIETLASENPLIRPRDSHNRPGGLVLLPHDRTTIIVPDLHARTGFIMTLMDMEFNGHRVIDSLFAQRLQIVCVGDGLHSEARGADRWYRALLEYETGFRQHGAMDEEMKEGLSLMAMIMLLKTAVPDSFHFLKGNHENVANSNEAGNLSFYKFAMEGQMVRDWFSMFMGWDMLMKWADFESSLPLLAVGDRFMISHAEPRHPYNRREVIEYKGNHQLILDFTWTGNNEAEEGSVESMLTMYLDGELEGSLYFGGHRPVSGLYGLRANGYYVQIHNPDHYAVAILESGRTPLPQRDVIQITGKDHG